MMHSKINLTEEQKVPFEKIKQRDANFLVADVGSGKTYIALKKAEYTKVKKILVICPLSVVGHWEDKIDTELQLDRIVINYDKLIIQKRFEEIKKYVDNETLIIVDEAHRIKNTRKKGRGARRNYITKRVVNVLALKDLTPYKICLTGTPQNKQYVDFVNSLIFLGLFPITLEQFEEHFCRFKMMNYGGPYAIKTLIGYRNTDLLDEFISENVIFHKLTKKYKPEEIYIKIERDKRYKELAKQAVYEDKILTAPKRRFLLDTINTENKIKVLEDLVEDLESERLVIFYRYNEELEALKQLFDKIKRPYSEYNGHNKDLTNFDKYENAVCFNNFGSGAEGTNAFIKSHIMIFFQYTDYLTFQQAKGRIDRMGQTKTPVYYYLVVEKTPDIERLKNYVKGQDYDDRMYIEYLAKEVI